MLVVWHIGMRGESYSNSSPSPLDVPVRRACFPSTLSMVEYLRPTCFSIKLLRIEVVLLTSTTQMQSYSIPTKDPRIETRAISSFLYREEPKKARGNTGPTRSGIKSDTKRTLMRINMKPSSVTIFGASHNGRSWTKPFHYLGISSLPEQQEEQDVT
jgi:hypothetical protein